jgi:rhodanese-related sulfurtransferase
MATGQTKDPAFSYMLKDKLSHNVPEISVADLQQEKYYFLDCREQGEYQVSHLPNAIFVGPNPSAQTFESLPRDKPWVFYCSVGIRSEKVTLEASRLHADSYNLVGGIFEWANQGKPLEDSSGQVTDKVHPYNRVWGVWLKAGTKSFE